MDVHTLSMNMANQAAASGGTQGTLNVQNADTAAVASKTGSGDTVDISPEARIKAAVSGTVQPTSANSDTTLTTRIAKLQKQLQQEQGSSNLDPDEKRSAIAALRNQIQMLQSQQPKSAKAGAGGTPASSLTTTHA
jgi:hypothetical protein